MKKGKTCKIQGFKKMKAVYGTVDSVDFKSVYLNIQTWVLPIKHSLNWSRVVLNMSREMKHLIYETLDNNMVNKNEYFTFSLKKQPKEKIAQTDKL